VALSQALESAQASERADTVLTGLVGACGDDLPNAARLFYAPSDREDPAISLGFEPDAKSQAIQIKACPNLREVAARRADAPYQERAEILYEGCDYQRFELLAIAELFPDMSPLTWGMHQWLLDQGITAEQAKPISLALFAAERRAWSVISPLVGQVIPKAAGVPISPGTPVFVSSTEIVFAEKKLVALRDGTLDPDDMRGHLIGPLHDAMAVEAEKAKRIAEQRGEDWDARVILVVDAEVPFATLVSVLHTAGRAEYRRYGFVVEDELSADHSMIPGSPPMPSSVEEAGRAMWARVDGSRIALGVRGPAPLEPKNVAASDYDAVRTYAENLTAIDLAARRAIVTAEPTAPYAAIIAVMTAARGPRCRSDGEGCLLADITIEAGASTPR
jgi:biopolymer transport protein ExbD